VGKGNGGSSGNGNGGGRRFGDPEWEWPEDQKGGIENLVRDDKITRGHYKDRQREIKKAAFLELLEHMRPTQVCDALEIPTRTAYGWREKDSAFADEWDRIQLGPFLDRIESVLAGNAMGGDNFAAICILNARHPQYRAARSARDSDLQPSEYADAMRSYLDSFKESIEPPPREDADAATVDE
jgi:hypothetical protein